MTVCRQTTAKGTTCGRPAKFVSVGTPLCGVHARAEQMRGGSIRPL